MEVGGAAGHRGAGGGRPARAGGAMLTAPCQGCQRMDTSCPPSVGEGLGPWQAGWLGGPRPGAGSPADGAAA